ncbi:MAG: ATP-binding protein [Thermoguttaceae bacterium]
MCEPQWIWQCERAIPSRSGAGRSLQQEILEQLRRHRWSDRDLFAVHLAMEEALANAIKHGNHYDANKLVRVWCRIAPELVRIEIADEGPGFDPSQVPDPTEPEHIESPTGRGIMLMRNFMSRVEFNELGNKVVLEKQRSQATAHEGAIPIP